MQYGIELFTANRLNWIKVFIIGRCSSPITRPQAPDVFSGTPADRNDTMYVGKTMPNVE